MALWGYWNNEISIKGKYESFVLIYTILQTDDHLFFILFSANITENIKLVMNLYLIFFYKIVSL